MTNENTNDENGGVITSESIKTKLVAHRLTPDEIGEKTLQLKNLETLKKIRDLETEKMEKLLEKNIPMKAINDGIQSIKDLIREEMIETENRVKIKACPSEIEELKLNLEFMEKERDLNIPTEELQNKLNMILHGKKDNFAKGIQSIDTQIRILRKEVKSGTAKDITAEDVERGYVN